ncbi:MAG: hypothetical protein HGB11_14365, partial [Chlorobiales bacterium]|nr:hypothetical protein [Chlorobiales bacterium]
GSEPNINLYNSLANAYLDLADVELSTGKTHEQVNALRRLADEATRRAYEENPDNSFVIETYVKNKLANANQSPELAVENCIEVLGVLYSVMTSNEGEYRRTQLADLADKALAILFRQMPSNQKEIEPANAIDVLVKAWAQLVDGVDYHSGISLSDISEPNRTRALATLEHPSGRDNLQIIRLTYDLTCVNTPSEFKNQLNLVEQLVNSGSRISPQLRLEYGLLLYQNNRHTEGEKVFRALRTLWRESEYFVKIPDRLRWLRDLNTLAPRAVQAFIGSDYDHRPMARVKEFGDRQVPFRPEEFGFRDLRPRERFSCHVSFGHNGPFLRPLTVGVPNKL